MPREAPLTGSHLDRERELCKKGCKEWIPWYEKKGKMVYGCRIGLIPEKRLGQWDCPGKRTKRRKGEANA